MVAFCMHSVLETGIADAMCHFFLSIPTVTQLFFMSSISKIVLNVISFIRSIGVA